jgi:hypothetical protein
MFEVQVARAGNLTVELRLQASGQRIRSWTEPMAAAVPRTLRLDTRDFQAGVYWVTVKTDRSIKSRSFVIR